MDLIFLNTNELQKTNTTAQQRDVFIASKSSLRHIHKTVGGNKKITGMPKTEKSRQKQKHIVI